MSTQQKRVRYRERQTLDAATLNAEQSYRMALQRGHHLDVHGWGIITGLNLELASNQLQIQPGLAVDGYGRLLIIQEPIRKKLPNAFTKIDVWLLYGRSAAAVSQQIREPHEAQQPNRWLETAQVCLTEAAQSKALVPPSPFGVPETDLDASGTRQPTDVPEDRWPVFLGRVVRDTSEVRIDHLIPLPYVHLNSEMILGTVPENPIKVQVGSELAGDVRHFAVQRQIDTGGFKDVLSINEAGHITLQECVTLKEGHLKLVKDPHNTGPQPIRLEKHPCDRGVEPDLPEKKPHGLELGLLKTVPETPNPWQMYHTKSPKEPPQDSEQSSTLPQQLRLELAHPGEKGEPARFRFVAGARTQNSFKEAFSVDGNCSTRIPFGATLNVEGDILESPLEIDVEDERLGPVLAEQWFQGFGQARRRIPPLQVEFILPKTISVNDAVDYQIRITNYTKATFESIQLQVKIQSTQTLNAVALTRKNIPPGVRLESFSFTLGQALNSPVAFTALALAKNSSGDLISSGDRQEVHVR